MCDRDRDGRGTRGHDVDRYTRSDADRAAGDERTSDKERDKQTERERPSDKDRPSERGRDRGSERGDKDRVGTDRDRKTDRSRDRGRTAQREGGSDRDRTSGTGEQEKDREQTSERYRDKDREDDLDHSGRRQESRDRGRDSKVFSNSNFFIVVITIIAVNPLIATLKLQSNRPSYSNAVIGILAVDGWAVTFGTARRGLGGAPALPGPSLLYQM